MMRIECCWPGKSQPNYIRLAVEDYRKRLNHFCKFTIKELAEQKAKSSHLLMHAECVAFEKYLSKEAAEIFLLDERGTQWTSKEFATQLNNRLLGKSRKLIFVIGGAFGFTEEFRNEYNQKISFGKFTCSHQIMRIVLCEQLFRAFTIIQNLPYHHE